MVTSIELLVAVHPGLVDALGAQLCWQSHCYRLMLVTLHRATLCLPKLSGFSVDLWYNLGEFDFCVDGGLGHFDHEYQFFALQFLGPNFWHCEMF